jgi:hypothetical protein
MTFEMRIPEPHRRFWITRVHHMTAYKLKQLRINALNLEALILSAM